MSAQCQQGLADSNRKEGHSQLSELLVTEVPPADCGQSVRRAIEGMLKWAGGWSMILKYPFVVRPWA